MPTFHYRAKNEAGKTINGKISAQTQDEAVELISQQGLLPITVEEEKLTTSSGKSAPLRPARISAKEIFYFSRQLSNLIKAGIPLLRALHLIREQIQNAAFKNILARIEQGIKDGKTFSDCLLEYPKIFNSFYVAMVRAGEESGSLKEMLLSLAEYQKNQYEIISKVRSALAYPVLMSAVGIGTVFFILTFVMPRITGLFINSGQELPVPTKILMGISSFLKVGWIGVIICIAAVVLFLYRWSQTKAGSSALSRLRLSLPFFGTFVLKVEMARFCRSLELLIRSGIPIIKAIQITTPILNNELIRQEFVNCQKDLEVGTSFGESLKKSPIIPGVVSNLITVGEEAGLLEEILRDIADSYEQETNETIKTMTTLLEPAMILIVGLVVGFIVVAMLLPIFQIDVLAQ